jgi:hypothetical protein
MPRVVLKSTNNSEPLPPHEQSLLNTLVFKLLCNNEVFSLISKVDKPQREAALQEALRWSLVHDLVSDD